MTFISAHFKNTPCLSYFIKRTPSHWRTFYKILYTWCIFKMCRNFTYEVVGHRKRPKAIKKNCSSKKYVILFFDREFFKYFFRVLHEASSSWLKSGHTFQ
jgi:hypothetical protein